VLKALLDDENSPVEFLLKKNNVNVAFVKTKVEESISKLPKVSGTEPAQALGRDLNNALLKANAAIKDFKDEFVSVEHLLLGILQGSDDMATLLKNAGVTEKGLKTAIKELRKGSTVNSQTSNQRIMRCRNMHVILMIWPAMVSWIPLLGVMKRYVGRCIY
jgi:ATP-dependent Clp protease ATP-binding subunit ClpB